MHFDNGRNEVLEVIDHGVTPLPPNRASYFAEGPAAHAHRPEADLDHAARGPELHRRRQLRAVAEVAVPHRVRSRSKGLVLHQVGYNDDDGRLRPILHRASISEMVVPYGDPDPVHGWKNAFDAGEWGLGRMTQSLHARLRLPRRDPLLRRDARDRAGQAVGHRERDLHARRGLRDPLEARRPVGRHAARCGAVVASSSASFQLSATTSTASSGTSTSMATSSSRSSSRASCRRWRSSRERRPPFANVIAEGVAAPHHQHMFNARLDFDVDGATNEIYEVDAERMPPGPTTRGSTRSGRSDPPRDRAARAARRRSGDVAHVADREPERAQRARPADGVQARADDVDADVARASRVVGRQARHVRAAQPLGHAVRARRAARRGRVPEPAPGWRRAARVDRGRPVARRHRRRRLVLVRRHALRAPRGLAGDAGRVHRLLLSPFGFFDRNPALDVPPTEGEHCHS